MEQFIGCDAHKKFSVFVAVNEKGQAGEALRVAHDRELYREFLAQLPAHSAIAVEANFLVFSRARGLIDNDHICVALRGLESQPPLFP